MRVPVRATHLRVLLVGAVVIGVSATSGGQTAGKDASELAGGAGPAKGPAKEPPKEPPKEPTQSVVIIGSSSINDFFGRMMEEEVAGLGLRVVRRGMPSAGLARPDFRDVMREVEELPLEGSRAVVLYFGGNDAQALWLWPAERTKPEDTWLKWDDERWSPTYEQRVVELIESVCVRGVPQAIVLPPADVGLERLQRRLERIRDIQRKAVGLTTCGRFVTTRGEGAGEGGGESLHAPDGVHMSRAGAQLLWTRIRPQLMELVR